MVGEHLLYSLMRGQLNVEHEQVLDYKYEGGEGYKSMPGGIIQEVTL